jgi:hypothetical protein
MALKNYAPAPENTMIGKAKFFFSRFDASDAQVDGYMHMGNIDKAGITVKPTVKTNRSGMAAAAGVYRTAISQLDLNIKIEGFEFGPEQVAMASFADVPTAFTQGTATVSAEALASATQQKHGRAYRTLNREISAVVVLNGVATLVSGTDYIVQDAHAGLIYFPEAGAVVDTTAVTVSYTAAAIASTANMKSILGASVSKVRGAGLLVGDPTQGPNYEIVIPRLFLASASEMDYVATDFGKWTLEGTIEDNTSFNPLIPYFQQIRRA